MPAESSQPPVLGERLLVFLKAPRPGTVKTRLAATLGEAQATAAYGRLVEAVLGHISELSAVELRYTPDTAASEISPWRRPTWLLAPQGGGDLGQRLARAFSEQFAGGARKVVIIGSDCPELTAPDIRAAWAALDHSDLVIGPAHDGGYWLIGLKTACPSLFAGIDWSTAEVLRQTLAQANAGGLRVAQLRTLSDIDSEADWYAWRAREPDAETESKGSPTFPSPGPK